MIILSKKSIIYTMGIIAMFIFTYMITGYNVNNSKKNNDLDVKTVQTVALPVNSKTIILDARTSEFLMSGAESSTRNNRS